MQTRRTFLTLAALTIGGAKPFLSQVSEDPSLLDPCGKVHIPIGSANALDTLKTFVEAEGNFSPGFGSYGIYFWIFDPHAGKLSAPTMKHIRTSHGLNPQGRLIPW